MGALKTPSRLASTFLMCEALSYLLPVTVDKRILEVSFLHCLVSPGRENSPLMGIGLTAGTAQPEHSNCDLTLVVPPQRQLTEEWAR